jgi:hypothetical protein
VSRFDDGKSTKMAKLSISKRSRYTKAEGRGTHMQKPPAARAQIIMKAIQAVKKSLLKM